MAWASIRLQFYMAWSSAHLQFNMNPWKNVTQIWDITTIRTKACDLLSRSGIVDILRRSGYPESDTLPTIILNFHNNMHATVVQVNDLLYSRNNFRISKAKTEFLKWLQPWNIMTHFMPFSNVRPWRPLLIR